MPHTVILALVVVEAVSYVGLSSAEWRARDAVGIRAECEEVHVWSAAAVAAADDRRWSRHWSLYWPM